MKINSNRWFLTLAQFSDFCEILLLNKEIHLFKQKIFFFKKHKKIIAVWIVCDWIVLIYTTFRNRRVLFTITMYKNGCEIHLFMKIRSLLANGFKHFDAFIFSFGNFFLCDWNALVNENTFCIWKMFTSLLKLTLREILQQNGGKFYIFPSLFFNACMSVESKDISFKLWLNCIWIKSQNTFLIHN